MAKYNCKKVYQCISLFNYFYLVVSLCGACHSFTWKPTAMPEEF
jgi:hypothetical protein